MKPTTVDEYIAQAPEQTRNKLERLRSAIRDAVPEALESISYGMPNYQYHGRLVYFGLAKRHIGLYIPSPIVDEHQDDLKGYFAHQATIHLPLVEDIPVALVTKLVQARARKNEEAISHEVN